jgi:recombination protein RecA
MQEEERQRAIRQRLARMKPGEPCPSLATGFEQLDHVLGIGGWPRGLIVELYGPASVGKTSLLLQSIAHLQEAGGAAAWIDADRSFDPTYAATLGVRVEALAVLQPETAEEAMEMALQLAQSGALEMLAVDSAAALVPQLELEFGTDLVGPSVYTRVLASGLNRLTHAVQRSGTCAIFLNQLRSKWDSAGQQVETSAGGAPLKMHAAMRISMAATGRRVRLHVVKNRVAEASGECELVWQTGRGFTKGP